MSARRLEFRDTHEKARWLDAAASLDAGTKYVRTLAHELVGDLLKSAYDAETKGERIATALHKIVRDEIRYEHDRWHGVRREVFYDAQTTVEQRFGDCDDKSRLLVALVRALGRPDLLAARIRAVFPVPMDPDDFRHVQVELRWPGIAWRLAEVTVEGVGIGDDPKRFRLKNGAYPLAGPKR